jgi:asparaginyl-tRNA synthetase
MLIKKILTSDEKIIDSNQKVSAWIRSIRDQKNFAFIELNDGSCLTSLQAVIDASNKDFRKIYELSLGASVEIEGIIVKSLGNKQKYELKVDNINILGLCPEDYPLQKKRASFEFLRTIAHLRSRTNTFSAITRIRSSLIYHTHKFFHEKDFLYIQTPIITASDTEGAGDLFRVTTLDDLKKNPELDFFKKKSYLTVSGQLNAESLACSLSNVYTFGPTFRAENSHTSRHLSEFWMMEPEIAFCDLFQDIKIAEEYIKYMIKVALRENLDDMHLFNSFIEKGLIERLEKVLNSNFEIVEYTDAIKILEKSNQKFEFEVKWGADLQSEHERYLTEKHFKKPTVVINYPKEIKAFYMRNNDDNKTVAAMDILVPKVGELVGGSQREERLDILENKIIENNLEIENYKWYLDLRRYGSVIHSGFGVGFERLIQFITGMENIKDVIAFPRSPGSCDF